MEKVELVKGDTWGTMLQAYYWVYIGETLIGHIYRRERTWSVSGISARFDTRKLAIENLLYRYSIGEPTND